MKSDLYLPNELNKIFLKHCTCVFCPLADGEGGPWANEVYK